MPLAVEQAVWDPRLLVVIGAISACLTVWVWVALRWSQRLPVLPYEPRRPVPWRGIDVLLMLMAYFLLPALVLEASRAGIERPNANQSEPAETPPPDNEHAVQRALSEKGQTAWPVVLSALLAIIIAPIIEELLFRLLLQGWLEAVERRARRAIPWLRRIVVGIVPVTIVALLFAAIHIRPAGPRQDVSIIVVQLQLFAAVSLCVIALIVFWLKYVVRATLADVGIVPRKLAGDVRTGLLSFLAVTPPVYAVLIAAKELLPEMAVADPIPLLFLGMALGGLYCRTHRIVPSIVTHMAFNAFGVFWTLAALQ